MKLKELNNKIKTEKEEKVCKVCKNVGYYLDKNRITRLCLTCLRKGKLNQDEKSLSQIIKGGIG